MSSWHEPRRETNDWIGAVALACAVPALFLGGYFILDFFLRWLAGWFV